MRRQHTAVVALCLCMAAWASAQTQAQAQPAVRVVAAEVGLFGAAGTDASRFLPTTALPLKDGQIFGWRMSVQTTMKKVLVREQLTLPREPATWGDPEPGIKRKTSPDGRSSTTELWLEPKDGFIVRTWSVTQGDPKGTWVIKLLVQGQAERVLRLEAR